VSRYAAGDNFTIDIEDHVAVCRLFRNVDLDHAGLARAATELAGHGRALTLSGEAEGMVVDVRRVPGAFAPEVVVAYAELAAAWEKTGQRIAFLALDDALQRMQLGRLVQQNAPRFGTISTDRTEARNFAGAKGMINPNTTSRLFDRPTRTKR